MRFTRYIQLIIIVLTLMFSKGNAQFYNGMNQDFGKSRVQFEEFEWSFYRYEHFDVYFNRGGKELAEFTAAKAEKHLKEIEQFFDYRLDGKLEFLVYNNQSEYFQSNVGNVAEEQNVGGHTRIVGSKVFLYFDGNHQHLERLVREGVTKVLIYQLMYGGNLKEAMKNSTLLTLPEWFVEGLVSFIANNKDPEVQHKIKDGIISGRFKKFNSLSPEDTRLAGHSLWAYIAENYGVSVIPNLLYMTKVSRNIESGFLFVLGISVKNISDDWLYHFKARYDNQPNHTPVSKFVLPKSKKGRDYYQFEINPKGNLVAFATHELNQYKVWIHDLETGKTKKLDRENPKLDLQTDLSFPLIEWHPSGDYLSVIRERKSEFIWQLINVESGEVEENNIFQLDKIIDFAYSEDGKYMVFSGSRNGHTDIYLYKVVARSLEKITDDIYDDLTPVFVDHSTKLIFASNRTDDTIRIDVPDTIDFNYQHDLFSYDLATKSNVLRRLTNTPKLSEMNPQQYDEERFSYLAYSPSDVHHYVGQFDSTITHIDTIAHYDFYAKVFPVDDLKSFVFEQAIDPYSKQVLNVYYHEGKFNFTLEPLKAIEQLTPKTILPNEDPVQIEVNDSTLAPFYVPPVVEEEEGLIDITNYQFEEEVEKKKEEVVVLTEEKDENNDSVKVIEKKRPKKDRWVFTNSRTYEISFLNDYLVSQLDNTFLNPMYQRYTGSASYNTPGPSGYFKLGATDILEDYKVTGGFRIGQPDNSEFFVTFRNLKKRWDKEISLYRMTNRYAGGEYYFKTYSHELTRKWTYPFSMAQKISITPSLRYDQTVSKAVSYAGLHQGQSYDLWGRTKVEYVFDNARNRGLNLYHGTRLKLFGEMFYKLEEKEKYMFVFGADIRNYTKIHKNIIWANRLAASTSGGTQKLLYYLGGVDNWLVPKFNNRMMEATDQNYVFQSIATNMRGFRQNIRNGNSFAVINSEIRWPIVKYFVNKPIRNEFLSNLQIVGFGDVGTAWTGPNPYSELNAFNIDVIGTSPVTVFLKTQQEPIVAGYGFGLRTKMWGYFIRADWSWGYDTGVVTPTTFYLSLNLDF